MSDRAKHQYPQLLKIGLGEPKISVLPAQVVMLYLRKMLNYERQCFGLPPVADDLVEKTCNNCDVPVFGESCHCMNTVKSH